MARTSLYDIQIRDLQGKAINLSEFKGKHLLFVNVASKCGFTPQYESLEKLSNTYKKQSHRDWRPLQSVWKTRTWKCRRNSRFLSSKTMAFLF